MTTLKINEQIAFLRKQKGLTQEELANALGVTNQAVSKWESAQCCPDIQLLPTIAEMFDVSVDELLGYKAASTTSDIILELRKKVDSLPKGEDFDFTFRAAAALHAILLSKDMTSVPEKNSGRDTDNAIEHAENAQWGNSCINVPEITTAMRKGTVFFSNNKGFNMLNTDIRRIVSIIKPFADSETLKIASALYVLTVHSEDAYTTPECISEECGLSTDRVIACLDGAISPFVIEHITKSGYFRFDGMYMNLIPMISMFDYR